MRRNNSLSHMLLGAALTLGASQAMALKELDDSSLSEVQGAGLAFPFESFRFEMAPTSFLQLTGSDTDPLQTTFIRGDLRYYGLSMSRASSGGPSGTIWNDNVTGWNGNSCAPGPFGLGCPISADPIVNFANFDNPYIWRAFNYDGYDTGGDLTSDRAVFEILGPSNMDPFRWAFFGEVESGRTYDSVNNGFAPISGANCDAGTGTNCLTQLQNIIIGKPVSLSKPPSIAGDESSNNPYSAPALRFFQYAGTTEDSGDNPSTYGIQYEHRLSGDYRLSINTAGGTVQRGVAPDFTDEEGLYFRNVQAYLPLGQLHYQALVFDDTQPGSSGNVTTDGNIAIEVTRIPNVFDVYGDFYSIAPGDTEGYTRTGRPDRYYQTHGYVEWGKGFPSNPNPNGMGDPEGVSQVRFSGIDPDGPTINLTTLPNSTCAGTGTYYGVSGDGFGTCTSRQNINVGDIFSDSNADDVFNTGFTREEVILKGGVVFVSKDSSSTWQVLHNQSRPRRENMIWVEYEPGGWFSDDTYELTRDARYNTTEYNPMLTVNAINLGSSRIEGLQINHLRIETLGGE